jgi:cellulose 1,4-beta-cellobiosidase
MKSILTFALAALAATAVAEDAQRPKSGSQPRPPPGGPGGKNAQRPPTGKGGGPQQGGGGGGGGAKGNPFAGGKMYANNFYAGEVAKALENMSDPSLKAKAAKAATISSFFWLYVLPPSE